MFSGAARRPAAVIGQLYAGTLGARTRRCLPEVPGPRSAAVEVHRPDAVPWPCTAASCTCVIRLKGRLDSRRAVGSSAAKGGSAPNPGGDSTMPVSRWAGIGSGLPNRRRGAPRARRTPPSRRRRDQPAARHHGVEPLVQRGEADLLLAERGVHVPRLRSYRSREGTNDEGRQAVPEAQRSRPARVPPLCGDAGVRTAAVG
jgi:hypothetical protein